MSFCTISSVGAPARWAILPFGTLNFRLSAGTAAFLAGFRLVAGFFAAGFPETGFRAAFEALAALLGAVLVPDSAVFSPVGLRRLPFRCEVSRLQRVSAFVLPSRRFRGPLPVLVVRLGPLSDRELLLDRLSADGSDRLSDCVRLSDRVLLSERDLVPSLLGLNRFGLPAGLGLLVGLAPARLLGVGFALLAGRLLPSALVSELCFRLADGLAGLPGLLPVPGRRRFRSWRGRGGLDSLAAPLPRGPPLRPLLPAVVLLPAPLPPPLPLPLPLPPLLVGRGFLPALGFRPVELFARGDALPLPAPFLTVN